MWAFCEYMCILIMKDKETVLDLRGYNYGRSLRGPLYEAWGADAFLERYPSKGGMLRVPWSLVQDMAPGPWSKKKSLKISFWGVTYLRI